MTLDGRNRITECVVSCPRCQRELSVTHEELLSEYTVGSCECSAHAWTPSEREDILEQAESQHAAGCVEVIRA